jgi:phage FluMu gp28-like protein
LDATVYVHTSTLLRWIEDDGNPVLAGEGRVIGTWFDEMRQVLDAARDLGTTGDGNVGFPSI